MADVGPCNHQLYEDHRSTVTDQTSPRMLQRWITEHPEVLELVVVDGPE